MPQDLPPADGSADSVGRLMQAATKPRCIEVELGEGLYGLDVEHVKEIVALKPMSRVFHAASAIAGIVNLRGDVLTVIDLPVLLCGTPSRRGPGARIVVLRDAPGRRRQAGLLVDGLGALRELPTTGLGPVPGTLPGPAARLIAGVVPTSPACSLLDLEALFESPELVELAHSEDSP